VTLLVDGLEERLGQSFDTGGQAVFSVFAPSVIENRTQGLTLLAFQRSPVDCNVGEQPLPLQLILGWQRADIVVGVLENAAIAHGGQ